MATYPCKKCGAGWSDPDEAILCAMQDERIEDEKEWGSTNTQDDE
jgi:hypothetical protein